MISYARLREQSGHLPRLDEQPQLVFLLESILRENRIRYLIAPHTPALHFDKVPQNRVKERRLQGGWIIYVLAS